jgi:hypothetical protein
MSGLRNDWFLTVVRSHVVEASHLVEIPLVVIFSP